MDQAQANCKSELASYGYQVDAAGACLHQDGTCTWTKDTDACYKVRTNWYYENKNARNYNELMEDDCSMQKDTTGQCFYPTVGCTDVRKNSPSSKRGACYYKADQCKENMQRQACEESKDFDSFASGHVCPVSTSTRRPYNKADSKCVWMHNTYVLQPTASLLGNDANTANGCFTWRGARLSKSQINDVNQCINARTPQECASSAEQYGHSTTPTGSSNGPSPPPANNGPVGACHAAVSMGYTAQNTCWDRVTKDKCTRQYGSAPDQWYVGETCKESAPRTPAPSNGPITGACFYGNDENNLKCSANVTQQACVQKNHGNEKKTNKVRSDGSSKISQRWQMGGTCHFVR